MVALITIVFIISHIITGSFTYIHHEKYTELSKKHKDISERLKKLEPLAKSAGTIAEDLADKVLPTEIGKDIGVIVEDLTEDILDELSPEQEDILIKCLNDESG
jgi:hypothetical protein